MDMPLIDGGIERIPILAGSEMKSIRSDRDSLGNAGSESSK